jgi:quercetin dioxygenase-like cupin family protein
MTRYLCATCGTQFAASTEPPAHCPICADERQYVGWAGQAWTTPAALRERHHLRIGDDAGLLAMTVEPAFAIPQRALLVPTSAGNLLWEALPLVTDEAVAALQARGGVRAIAISHPHFYAAMADWSEALGGVPIWLHADDRNWVQCPLPQIRFWEGDRLELGGGATLVRVGGHFEGSTVLHWREGPRPGGALFAGDSLHVAADRRHVAFFHSNPNFIPMAPSRVRRLQRRLEGLAFDDVYGYSWGRNILGDGVAAVARSVERHLRFCEADALGIEHGEWIPEGPGKWSRPLAFLPDGAGWVELMRLTPGTALGLHRHSGEVHAYNLRGWRELGTGERLGPGAYVHEPAGNVDRWEAIGDEDLVVLAIVKSEVDYLDAAGGVARRITPAERLADYRQHCARQGLPATLPGSS